MAAWAQALATVIAVIVAGFLTYVLRDQQKAKIHEKRLDAYGGLWGLTKDFRINGPPIDRECCHKLADQLTEWYFRPGGGMLITSRTLPIFLRLRDNLTCDPYNFSPPSWRVFLHIQGRSKQELDQRRFLLLQRQFSLLRTQMKNDCAIYYGRDVSSDPLVRPYDVDFLRDAKLEDVGIWKRAIKAAIDAKDAKEEEQQANEDANIAGHDASKASYLRMLEKRYQGTPDSHIRLG